MSKEIKIFLSYYKIISIKILIAFFHRNRTKKTLKFVLDQKKFWIAKATLRKKDKDKTSHLSIFND